MAEKTKEWALLKDVYNPQFIDELAFELKKAYPSLDDHVLKTRVFENDWESLELKQRMRRITESMISCLPEPFEEALAVLIKAHQRFTGLQHMIFPDFVEVRGLDYPERSNRALAIFTPNSSSEFAVRPFIMKYPEMMLKQLEQWTQDENEHVRRLASEGCRPRLPWAMALPQYKKDPTPIIGILEKLKEDTSEYVRKSVANNLNDISKDHPGLVLDLARKWQGKHKQTDWIIKHGCRTLLKKCDPEALALFGFAEAAVAVKDLVLNPATVRIGDEAGISFSLKNESDTPQMLRIECGVDFLKSRGTYSRKLFKLSEKMYPPGETMIRTSHSFKPLTTRTYYPGEHHITIIVNGRELSKASVIVEM